MSFFSVLKKWSPSGIAVVKPPSTASGLTTSITKISNELRREFFPGGPQKRFKEEQLTRYVGTILAGAIVSHYGGSIGGSTYNANNTASGANNGISAGIGSEISSSVGSMLTGVNNILNGIHTAITDVGNVEQSIVSPIANLVHGVTTDVQALNDQVITPVRNLITSYTNTANAITAANHADLHNGIMGMLKYGQDLSNALTSFDAQAQRAMQELGQHNEAIVSKTLVPGLNTGIGGPIQQIADTMKGPEFNAVKGAAFNVPVHIASLAEKSPILQQLIQALNEVESATGNMSWLVKYLYDVLLAVDYMLAQAEATLIPVKQQAMSEMQPELLGVGETIEAWRRGIIKDADAEAELLKHGINPSRMMTLYELAQFLFGPRETIELYARGIIDQQTYTQLLGQNNLDSGQANALTELMQHILGPGDIAAAYARGEINADQRTQMFNNAMVPASIQDLIQSLELTLVNPERMIANYGKQIAAANGFLAKSLGSAPPSEILSQFARIQAEPGAAEQAWIAHWDVPGAAWWVDAYFRKLRTRTELENAFEALRIPEELWDDIISVEEELPPVWLVPDVIATGVWGESEAVPVLEKLGFSPANAKVLYDYGVAKGAGKAAATADSLAKVSLGNAKTAFDDGLIDSAEYEQILIAHKYSPAAAALTVQIAEYEATQAYIKSEAQLIVAQVKLGQITQQLAEADLVNLGLSTNQVATYMMDIERAKVIGGKLPSEAELKAIYKKGGISQQEALDTMMLLGYSAKWAGLIMDTW